MIKRLLTLLVTAVFTMCLASPALSGTEKELNGVVSKIEGSKLTVLNGTGVEETVEIKDQKLLNAIKVGDQVSIKNDTLTKGGAESPAPVSRK